MKRTIVILALVTAFVLAFSAVAQATWRGFTPIRTQAEVDAGKLQGFITWDEALDEMARNHDLELWVVDTTTSPATPVLEYTGQALLADQAIEWRLVGGAVSDDAWMMATAHGGYVTTSTKCVVCHSAHRATGLEDPDALGGINNPGTAAQRNQNQAFLTAGADGCAICHTVGSGQASRLLVEWDRANGGPHVDDGNRGCVECHSGGIHGLGASEFHVMNIFLLGGNNDAQIRAEMDLWTGPDSRGNTVMAHPDDIPASPPGTGNAWWYNGATGLSGIGGLPGGVSATQYGAARSMATAYTCSVSGCHVTGAFFTVNWGVGFERESPVSGGASAMVAKTGHVMPSARAQGGANVACGPCHAGNPAGFPTATSIPGGGARDDSRRAYGCDQCHDMVGVATNSTAWPHGNRGIAVYEWLADGTQLDAGNIVNAGNLWMYGGNIARVAGAGIPNNGTQTGFVEFNYNTSANANFADNSWRVLTGVTSGENGLPGTGTGLTDGSCLKCHVAIDAASMTAMGSTAADALQHAWRGGAGSTGWTTVGGVSVPYWNNVLPNNQSGRLFLYR